MSSGYLKNILNKNNQSSPVVQPRLQSRYENTLNVEQVNNQNISPDLQTPIIQNNSIENFRQANVKSTVSKIQDTSSSEILTPPKVIDSRTISNNTETPLLQDFIISEEKNIEEKENKIPYKTFEKSKKELKITTQKASVVSKSLNEDRTFGLLNKPVTVDVLKENSVSTNNYLKDPKNTSILKETPTIKILIGSIEVKGVKDTPIVKPRQKVTSSLKLSLDEYIEKKNNKL